jgi:hypothetical protein
VAGNCPDRETGASGQAEVSSIKAVPTVPPVPTANDNVRGKIVLEPVGVVLGEDGSPSTSCATCGESRFHQAPRDHWRCSICEPPELPPAHRQAGWAFCHLPGSTPEGEMPPEPTRVWP